MNEETSETLEGKEGGEGEDDDDDEEEDEEENMSGLEAIGDTSDLAQGSTRPSSSNPHSCGLTNSHRVYLLAKTAPFPAMTISEIMHKHKAPSFLQCFTQFTKNIDATARQPKLSDSLPVYKQFIIEHSVMIAVSPNPLRMKIRAIPTWTHGQKISPDRFDTVLVSVGSERDTVAGSLTGTACNSNASICVYFNSIFLRNSGCQS